MSAYLGYILVMAVVTYLIRMLPLALVQREIKSPFLKSFLFYVPYAVLGAMSFPAIFTSGGATLPSVLGSIFALYLAYQEKSLISVAIGACFVVYVSDYFLQVLNLI